MCIENSCVKDVFIFLSRIPNINTIKFKSNLKPNLNLIDFRLEILDRKIDKHIFNIIWLPSSL